MKILFLFFIIIIINFLIIIKKLGIGKDIINTVKKNVNNFDNQIDFRYNELAFNDNEYERFLSFHNDLNYIYWLSISYGIINVKTNIIGAYLTKWYKNNYIKIIDRNNKLSRFLYNFKKKTHISIYDQNGKSIIKNKIYIVFNKGNNISNDIEKKLFNIMAEACGVGEINEDDFFDWILNNSEILSNWFNELYINTTKDLINKNLINVINEKYIVTDKILDNAITLNNYKNFLCNFVNFKDEKLKDVHMYDEYIVNSVLLGINSKIKNELGNVYPKFLFDISNLVKKLNTIDF